MLAFLFLLSEVGLCQTKATQQGQTEKAQPKPQAPPPITVVAQTASQYKPHCNSPPTREDAEYCQEWRATVATEEQAKWAYYQFLASVTGIGAVVITLVFTAKATSAAVASVEASQRSADAATRATEIAERALVDLEAPNIFLEIEREFNEITTVVPGTLGGSTANTIKVPGEWYFQFVNYGRTPALLLTVNGDLAPVNKKAGIPEMVKESDIRIPRGAVVPPGDRSKKFTIRMPIIDETISVFFGVCCRYSDIFNNEYLAGFSYIMANEDEGFRLTDFKSGYNYLTLVKSGTQKNKG